MQSVMEMETRKNIQMIIIHLPMYIAYQSVELCPKNCSNSFPKSPISKVLTDCLIVT